MAQPTYSGPLGELRSASTAAGGTALTTAPVVIPLPAGIHHVMIEGRNYTAAVVSQIALTPYLFVLKTADDLATVTDYSSAAQDNNTSTDVVLSSLDTIANLDYIMVGSHLPFRGVVIDVDATNSVASVLTVKYRKSDNTWATTSATDGTISAATTMAVDGNVTWTMPTDWIPCKLTDTGTIGAAVPHRGSMLYWTRWEVSVALDASTTLNSMMALARSTAYYELPTGRLIEEEIKQGPYGWAGIEARTDAGTANLIVNASCNQGTLGFL